MLFFLFVVHTFAAVIKVHDILVVVANLAIICPTDTDGEVFGSVPIGSIVPAPQHHERGRGALVTMILNAVVNEDGVGAWIDRNRAQIQSVHHLRGRRMNNE